MVIGLILLGVALWGQDCDLGVLLADEPLTVEVIVEGAVVIAAVYVGALSQQRTGTRQAGKPATRDAESAAAR
jgi:hypothetical protein